MSRQGGNLKICPMVPKTKVLGFQAKIWGPTPPALCYIWANKGRYLQKLS